ncbi:MAG TPA: MFS transporter [Xanthobacteraceae bacterium]
MSTPSLSLAATRAAEFRIVANVSAAHFLSHFYFLVLPPLFSFVRADYDVSYTELGVALAMFNMVSALFQTPAGLLADRVGPHVVLVGGLALEAVAFALAGLVDSYWFLVAMFGVAGLANTVFHPADYALLSHHISKHRVGQAFSIHTFAGMLGGAVAPAAMLLLEGLFGWRGAFVVAALAGLAAAALLMLQRADYADGPHRAATAPAGTADGPVGRRALLMQGAILRSLLFFTLLAAVAVGIQNYSVVALEALFGTPLAIGNAALTSHLLFTAVGVLAGGLLVARISNHGAFAAVGLCVTCLAVGLVGLVELGTATLILVMGIGGFANGVIMPSRDMLVRAVTPPGSFGTVFGFVTTGFNIAGVAFPLVFGALMDRGSPRAIFLVSAAFCLLSIAAVIGGRRR